MGAVVWSVVRSHFLTGLDIVGVRKYYRLLSDRFGSVMGLMASEIFSELTHSVMFVYFLLSYVMRATTFFTRASI